MKRITLSLIILGVISSIAFSQAAPRVYSVPVKGVIDLGLSGFVKRALEEAKANEASAVIFEIDTFGGRVDAVVNIGNYIEELHPIPTFAFVKGEAWSAGALIALACESIIMSPGSSIGSAEPRAVGMMQQQPTDEKTVSALRAKFKSIAEQNKHPANLAAAMVDKDIELKKISIKGKVEIVTAEELEERKSQFREGDIKIIKTVSAKGKLLNLTAEEAFNLKLADKILSTREELLDFARLKDAEVIEGSLTWSEKLVRFLTHPVVSSLLLTLGSLGILFELRMPGWGISGTVGIVCLMLFFWGHYLIGLANWTEILLFLVGIMLLALEVFVIPGFGIAGISGILSVLAGIFLALIKHPFEVPRGELIQAFYTMAYSFIIAFMVILLSFKFLPQLGLWKRLVLAQQEKRAEGFRAAPSRETYLGKTGMTLSHLRPSGRAAFGDEILDVVSEGGFIERGKEVKVVNVEGNRIVVSEV